MLRTQAQVSKELQKQYFQQVLLRRQKLQMPQYLLNLSRRTHPCSPLRKRLYLIRNRTLLLRQMLKVLSRQIQTTTSRILIRLPLVQKQQVDQMH